MKERPILFSAPMVRALLAGTKTQTRRVVKMLPLRYDSKTNSLDVEARDLTDPRCLAMCPYGVVGDRLWVRETWAAPHSEDARPPRAIQCDQMRIHYAASEDRGGLLWRPSIHMPRWASRIALEVVAVRVERLADISDADAIAEGITPLENGRYPCHFDDGKTECLTPKTAYASLWAKLHGAESWAANPYVWVVEFKRLEGGAA